MVNRHVKSFLLLLLVFSCSSPSLIAQTPEKTYADGVNHLYNLDFPEAEAAFLSLTKSHPENPDYWNVLGTTYWLKVLYGQQKLNMESFGSKDRFGTDDSDETGYEAEARQIREVVAKAVAAADAMLKKDPKSVRARYAKGVSNATLASFEATILRERLSAARKAKAARDEHNQVLAMDPNFHDARVAVGIYNYAVGSLPWIVRLPLSAVGLGGGDKPGGIKEMETAAAKGARSATDAKMLLVIVYARELQYDKSIKLIDELQAKYPRNFMLDMTRASLYGRQGKWDLAATHYKQIAEKTLAKKDGYERLRIERVYYELANSQFHGQKFDDAIASFNLVVRGANSTPNEKANAHLWMGRMADTSKKREEAMGHYNAVLALDAAPNLKADARALLKRPFGR
jgi:tetratricopeptide (TPR) repeat protein